MTYTIRPIGTIRNGFLDPAEKPEPDSISEIIVDHSFAEGLKYIEKSVFIDILFFLDRSGEQPLITTNKLGQVRGIFATRSPHRQNKIAVTTCRLISRKKNVLRVTGLDALDGSPLIDIKPADNSIFNQAETNDEANIARLRANPRETIINQILAGRSDTLLLGAGQLHGHFCPGLAMGIMASMRAVSELRSFSDGMENTIAITETNNCFSDGVQYVTGCTFGNNALIYKDLGKTALTLSNRDGNGIRICSKPESGEIIRQTFPDFEELYQKVVVEQHRNEEMLERYKKQAVGRSFGTLEIPFDHLFSVSYPVIEVPDYAPIHESIVCDKCHESVMATRTVKKGRKYTCFDCSENNYFYLTGEGIKRGSVIVGK